ncbi:MAG: imelysin family protein [Sedimenticola sp.]
MLKKYLLITALLLSGTVQAYDFKTLAEGHIIPAYQHLADKTAALKGVADRFCEQPDMAEIATLRNSYKTAFLAWQGAQHLRFGPVQYLSRAHRLELWPDKRGTVGKHLAQLLNDPKFAKGPVPDISKKSVAVQGFSALERLLYGNKKPEAIQCRAIEAITKNLQTIGRELHRDWAEGDTAYLNYFSQPGPGNMVYESNEELASQLLNSLYTQLEFILTQKLDRPLGKSLKKSRGKRAEGWRSGSALPAIEKNLAACHVLYRDTFASELKEHPLHTRIDIAFTKAMTTLSGIDIPLSKAITDDAQRPRVEQLRMDISHIKKLLARQLAPELNLSLGFNSLDGD